MHGQNHFKFLFHVYTIIDLNDSIAPSCICCCKFAG